METITEMDLARLVFGADEMKCESPTHDNGKVECSHEVSYVLSSCKPDVRVCSSMGSHARNLIADPTRWCLACRESISDCWTIRPI